MEPQARHLVVPELKTERNSKTSEISDLETIHPRDARMSDMWGGGDRKLVGIDSQGVHFSWPDFFCSFTNSQGVHFFGPPKLYPHPDSIPTSLLRSP